MSAVSDAGGGMRWQTIETAPKKQIPRLLINVYGGMAVGYWSIASDHWIADGDLFNPTHWMPLPPPPSPQEIP